MTAVFDYREAMTVDVPEGTVGTATIARFTVADSDARWSALREGGRGVRAGTYTKLLVNGRLWMSDTHAEQTDHYEPVRRAQRLQGSNARVLITGLGIGMVVQAMILTSSVAHIDVVELNPDVVALVGPHYEAKAREHGKTLTIHTGDAHERGKLFDGSQRWDLAWHDIWQDICGDNWESMKTMRRRYARYVDWQGCWADRLVKRAVEQEREEERRMSYFRAAFAR